MIAIAMAAVMVSTPDLGKREGQCRTPEPGPALMIDAVGLKDRTGLLRAELYPAVDGEFLADDNKLLAAGKTFARVDMPLPASGAVRLCIRVPRPGRFALMLLHDRNADLKFELSSDGVGFPGNPRLGWTKPRAAEAIVQAGPALTPVEIRLNYRRGLAMRPLEDK